MLRVGIAKHLEQSFHFFAVDEGGSVSGLGERGSGNRMGQDTGYVGVRIGLT